MTSLFALFLIQDLATLSSAAANAMREQRYSDAVGIYRGLVQKDATNPMWRLNLGMALSYVNNHRDAVSELTTFIKARDRKSVV